jgi:hypothetical protein
MFFQYIGGFVPAAPLLKENSLKLKKLSRFLKILVQYKENRYVSSTMPIQLNVA